MILCIKTAKTNANRWDRQKKKKSHLIPDEYRLWVSLFEMFSKYKTTTKNSILNVVSIIWFLCIRISLWKHVNHLVWLHVYNIPCVPVCATRTFERYILFAQKPIHLVYINRFALFRSFALNISCFASKLKISCFICFSALFIYIYKQFFLSLWQFYSEIPAIKAFALNKA